jgi:holo-[acyl-carrier protein] synthase
MGDEVHQQGIYCSGDQFLLSRSVSSLALRFAAKEAFSKAIGLGMKRGIRWRDIEVVQTPNGRPDINVTGEALSFCRKEGIGRWHVTLSDESYYGIAVVVLETGGT